MEYQPRETSQQQISREKQMAADGTCEPKHGGV